MASILKNKNNEKSEFLLLRARVDFFKKKETRTVIVSVEEVCLYHQLELNAYVDKEEIARTQQKFLVVSSFVMYSFKLYPTGLDQIQRCR